MGMEASKDDRRDASHDMLSREPPRKLSKELKELKMNAPIVQDAITGFSKRDKVVWIQRLWSG